MGERKTDWFPRTDTHTHIRMIYKVTVLEKSLPVNNKREKRERERIRAEKCATGGCGQQKRPKTDKEKETDGGWLVAIDGFFIGACCSSCAFRLEPRINTNKNGK